MRLLAAAALLLSFPIAHADSNQDAFNAGANFGKGNASQATNSLSNPGIVADSIPGFTSTPPEAGYYGGIRGGDGGISNKGLIEFSNSDVGKAITDSSIKNPATVIDPTATFITNGKNAESNSETIVDGTNKQCSQTVVSKSVFEKFSCDRDVWNENICTRTASVGGANVEGSETKTVTLENSDFIYKRYDTGWTFGVVSPVSGVVKKATLITHVDTPYLSNQPIYTVNQPHEFMGTLIGLGLSDMTTPLNMVGKTINEGDVFTSIIICGSGAMAYWECDPNRSDRAIKLFQEGKVMHMTLVIEIESTNKFEPKIDWKETCAVKKDEVAKISEVCVEPGGEKTITVEGKDYTVHSDCWEYQDTYAVPSGSDGNCGTLSSAANCTVVSHECTSQIGTYCEHENVTYECETKHESSGLLCGGDYFCQSGDCAAIDGAGDSGFDMAVAKLAGLASAADDVKNEQESINVKAFTGEAMSCRKAMAGFSNCCKDSGWGQDVGLSQCNSDEMALGKAKAKKVTVNIGERCDRKVLGACLQKSQVYCVFGGKLARIIQEQGRRDQLSIGFGSSSNPDCRGITVPELQGIDFDKLNFSDFYEDLMANQTVPNTDVMVKQVKDRIAAQVQQSGANK